MNGLKKFVQTLPEMPAARRERYVSELGLPEYDAMVLTINRKKCLISLKHTVDRRRGCETSL